MQLVRAADVKLNEKNLCDLSFQGLIILIGLFTTMILSFTKKQHIFRNVNKQFISCPKLSLNDLLRPNCLTTISFLFFNI